MTYIMGKNCKLFMTTEHATAQVIFTGSTAVACDTATDVGIGKTASANYGVANLGEFTGVVTEADDKIRSLDGVDYKIGFELDSFQPFGVDQEQDIALRKNWELTITRKSENDNFRKLFDGAKAGCITTASLNNADSDYDDNVGYRFYLWDGNSWMVFYHGVAQGDGYDETIDVARVKTEAIKFKGNYWSGSVASASLTASLALS